MAKLFVSNDQDASARIFKSDFLEKFTRVHWSVPLWIFVPIILYFIYRSYSILFLNPLTIILYIFIGIFIWTLTEYVLHRWLFHYHPTSDTGKRLIFMFHGVHHDYPSDKWRLVMPPSVSLPLATIFYIFFYLIFKFVIGMPWLTAPFFAGFLVGYLFYDITHYALHHFGLRKKFWLNLKKHHTKHHFRNPDLGFGVSNSFWDVVFRTGYKK